MIRGREAVKKVIRKCVVCLKHEGLPYGTHQPGDLPNTRVSDDPPFSHVGLDFAGPIYFDSKDREVDNERSSKKSYVCLFTCSSTRAVHLELCRSLNVFRTFYWHFEDSRVDEDFQLRSRQTTPKHSRLQERKSSRSLDPRKLNSFSALIVLRGILSWREPLGGAGFGRD